MRRIVSSLFVIGAVLTLVVGAGTFALFTDTQNATGDVNAGTINLHLSDSIGDDNGENEFIFTNVENLLPGESVNWGMVLENRGTRAWDQTDGTVILSQSQTTDPGAFCATALVLTWIPDGGDDDHGTTLHVEPGANDTGTIRATLPSGAGNECQGSVWAITGVFNVTQH